MNRMLRLWIMRHLSMAARGLGGPLLVTGLVFLGTVLACAGATAAGETADSKRFSGDAAGAVPQPAVAVPSANYERVCEPPIKPAFWPLPPGSVEPAGWLGDWAVAARHGITGHLDEDHAVFADAWKGFQIKAPNAAADGTGWPLEQCAYWLDGAASGFRPARRGFDQEDSCPARSGRGRRPQSRLRHLVHLLEEGLQARGFQQLGAFAVGLALVALYQGTGDRRVLDALVKVYADYPVQMGPTHFHDVSGLCNLEAMLETYSWSGDKRILDRAVQAVAQPGVAADIRPGASAAWPPATWSSSTRTSAYRPWSTLGPATGASAGHFGLAAVAGRQPHAALRRRLGRGVCVGRGRVSARRKPAT